MPHIIVKAEASDEREGAILMQERVRPADFESDHFSAQLVERVGWAVVDAQQVEGDRPQAR